MTGYIKEQAGDDNAGKWDIANVPGGGGNWGGSFLAVPPSSEHQDLAIELVQFLTSAEGQLGAFDAVGNLPSNPTLYEDPAVKGETNDVLQRRPVGQIFVSGARDLQAGLPRREEPAGARRGRERAAQRRDRASRSSDDGWATAVSRTREKAAS